MLMSHYKLWSLTPLQSISWNWSYFPCDKRRN
jgi:hypothetical protein